MSTQTAWAGALYIAERVAECQALPLLNKPDERLEIFISVHSGVYLRSFPQYYCV